MSSLLAWFEQWRNVKAKAISFQLGFFLAAFRQPPSICARWFIFVLVNLVPGGHPPRSLPACRTKFSSMNLVECRWGQIIFTPDAHKSRFVCSLYYKTALCHTLVWWEAGEIPTWHSYWVSGIIDKPRFTLHLAFWPGEWMISKNPLGTGPSGLVSTWFWGSLPSLQARLSLGAWVSKHFFSCRSWALTCALPSH